MCDERQLYEFVVARLDEAAQTRTQVQAALPQVLALARLNLQNWGAVS